MSAQPSGVRAHASPCRRLAAAVCGPQQFEPAPCRPRATRRLEAAGTACIAVWLTCVLTALGQTPPPKKGGKGGPGNGEVKMPTPAFRTEVPAHSHDVLLGRPTRNSVSASVLAFRELEVFLEHGTMAGTYSNKTAPVKLLPGEPRVLNSPASRRTRGTSTGCDIAAVARANLPPTRSARSTRRARQAARSPSPRRRTRTSTSAPSRRFTSSR